MQTPRRILLFTLAFIFLTTPGNVSAQSPLQFVPVLPCRVVDTRHHGQSDSGWYVSEFCHSG